VKRAVALNFRFDGKQAGGLVKFHTCADPVGGTGPGEVRMRTDTRPLTRLGRAGRPSDRRSAMRTASALTLAVASALARTRWSHGASGRASTRRLAAPQHRTQVLGQQRRHAMNTTTVRTRFVLVLGLLVFATFAATSSASACVVGTGTSAS